MPLFIDLYKCNRYNRYNAVDLKDQSDQRTGSNGCRTDRKYAKNTCPLISVLKSRLQGGEDHRGRFQERVNRTRTAFVTDKERLTNGQNGQGTFN